MYGHTNGILFFYFRFLDVFRPRGAQGTGQAEGDGSKESREADVDREQRQTAEALEDLPRLRDEGWF